MLGHSGKARSRRCHMYHEPLLGLKAFCLRFYLCAGQVRPKIRRLRVQAAIVRWYVRNTVESPCGNLSPSLCFSFHPGCCSRSFSRSRSPGRRANWSICTNYAMLHCSRMVQLAPHTLVSMLARIRIKRTLCTRVHLARRWHGEYYNYFRRWLILCVNRHFDYIPFRCDKKEKI